MNYPKAYIDYLVQFHGTRDLFECHEILEEYWKEHPNHPYAEIWVGLIQIAVALYHERRANLRGAVKMMGSAIRILSPNTSVLHALGLDSDIMLLQLNKRLEELQQDKSLESVYEDFNLPIKDRELMNQCLDVCKEQGITWLQASDLAHDELIHRHTLRDRSEVINERSKQWERRRKQKQPAQENDV